MDGTGSIDFPEFLTLIAKIQKEALDDKDEIREAFTVFDKDGTGFLSKEKVKELIEELGIPLEEIEMKQMMESFRFNNEGKINVEQFVKVVFNDLKQMWILYTTTTATISLKIKKKYLLIITYMYSCITQNWTLGIQLTH